MKKILKFILFLLFILFIFFLNFLVKNILPNPFNNINIVFLVILWLIVLSVNKEALLISVPLSFLLEIYSSTYFGIISISILLSLFIINWFLVNIFTNRSLYILFLSYFAGILLYKILFIILVISVDFLFFFKRTLFFSWSNYFVESFWEIFLTSILGLVFLFIISLFSKRLNPKYIKMDRKNIYERRYF